MMIDNSGQSSPVDAKATQTRLPCSQVEIIATKMLRSSSQSGWPLRNIHISNDYGYFTFYIDVSILYHCQDFTGFDCIYE
jgi:hypothetical protein